MSAGTVVIQAGGKEIQVTREQLVTSCPGRVLVYSHIPRIIMPHKFEPVMEAIRMLIAGEMTRFPLPHAGLFVEAMHYLGIRDREIQNGKFICM